MKLALTIAATVSLLLPSIAAAEPIPYSVSRKLMYSDVFFDHRETLYCGAAYDVHREVKLPDGFVIHSHASRANRAETEHIVPAENFGRTFREWREGDPICVHSDGTPFKGRRCAQLANEEYRLMEADMHNLYPAIGCVNAARGNRNFTQLEADAPSSFGTCQMKIEGKRVEPPARARGIIARAYLYFEQRYARYNMSRQQRRLMESWDAQYPVTEWECVRNRRIKAIQGNGNPFVERMCR